MSNQSFVNSFHTIGSTKIGQDTSGELESKRFSLIDDTVADFSKQRSRRIGGATLPMEQKLDDSLANDGDLSSIVAKIVATGRRPPGSEYFLSVQKWKGHIINLGESSFEAKLEDLTSPGTYEIEEFEKKEVSPGDIDLLKVGSAFYWSVGFGFNGNQIEKKSLIRFQRLAAWTAEEYDQAIDEGTNLYNYLSSER